MLLSKKGHFNYIWRQAYKCPGMDYCAKLYSYATWCASNGRSYSSVCQINVHSCILNKELQAEYKGLCSRNGSEFLHILDISINFNINTVEADNRTPRNRHYVPVIRFSRLTDLNRETDKWGYSVKRDKVLGMNSYLIV